MTRDRCQEPNPCINNRHRMPCDWINIVMNDIENPTGVWRDYNNTAKRYLAYEDMSSLNKYVVCEDDLPATPNPADYADLEAEATR